MSEDITFFVGLHQPSDAHRFKYVFLSINRLRGRKKPIPDARVVIDSGAFTELEKYGRYRHSVEVYAAELHRLYTANVCHIEAAVAQDYMCEPFMLAKTGMSIEEHQRLTIERYDALVAELSRLFSGAIPFHVLPVLQGYAPADYVRHVAAYGARLLRGMWVGVGSVCKRNSAPEKIASVLRTIRAARPDLRLHGFGVKLTSLLNSEVRDHLATADSMAWSFAARKQGRSANAWQEAAAFVDRINAAVQLPRQPYQLQMFGEAA
jgi:hypothetical protein